MFFCKTAKNNRVKNAENGRKSPFYVSFQADGKILLYFFPVCDILCKSQAITERSGNTKLRRYISVFLVLMMFLSTAVVTYAGSNIQVNTLNREIVVNGVNVVNYCTDYPYFEYESTFYAPLAEENCNILGLSIVREEPNSIVLKEITPIQVNYQSTEAKDSNLTLSAAISEKTVEILKSNGTGGYDTTVLTSEITQGKPILEYNGVVYIPLTEKVIDVALQWGKMYDDYTGLYLGTLASRDNTVEINEDESAYNKALAEYIMSCNPSYTLESATDLVFVIKKYADLYGVDEKLVMAMIQTESTFKNVTSSGGAIGMMQIMGSTGRAYGLSKADLLDVEKNIKFGTEYISRHIATFGTVEKALVAYNQGGAAVNRGKTSSRYSNLVLSRYDAIVNAAEGN
ncbi:MAG: lytic transglycosylase domain-containing protein [Clostridiales bacterium]|nr:lytic transglycosylase domain-containing protein [Clostridiales bacterium]